MSTPPAAVYSSDADIGSHAGRATGFCRATDSVQTKTDAKAAATTVLPYKIKLPRKISWQQI